MIEVKTELKKANGIDWDTPTLVYHKEHGGLILTNGKGLFSDCGGSKPTYFKGTVLIHDNKDLVGRQVEFNYPENFILFTESVTLKNVL